MFISDFSSGREMLIYSLESLCITKIDLEMNFKENFLCNIKLSKFENLILGCSISMPKQYRSKHCKLVLCNESCL